LSAGDSLVTPERYLAYLRAQGLPPAALEVAPVALLGWGGLRQALVEAAGGRRRRGWPYDSEWPYYEAEGLGVTQLPTGGPAAAFLLDQLVACGARALVTVGIAGSLLPSVPPGAVVVAAEAIAGDGTSPHYSPGGRRALPASPGLVDDLLGALANSGVDARIGTTWTTDAPFRETPAAIEAARSREGLTVDMEAAAVYALAAHRGVEACAVLVVTDGVWDRWHPAFGTRPVRRALEVVGRVLPPALAGRRLGRES
jgi:uridine phosphorylase